MKQMDTFEETKRSQLVGDLSLDITAFEVKLEQPMSHGELAVMHLKLGGRSLPSIMIL